MDAQNITSQKHSILDEIISYIQNNYSSKITLENTAYKFHISKSLLGMLFRNNLRISFYNYVQQIRLSNSKKMIDDKVPMYLISQQVGFNDYSSFYRAFKKEYGLSPTEYKNRLK